MPDATGPSGCWLFKSLIEFLGVVVGPEEDGSEEPP
eukprot:CAMPEP_0202973690 /NCGR_PEP_ID=MMETSP1396-20130829/52999_1 /ASSEMBLY_ACC=CAM_ASM_000872 /TAXON_ID= /ORGANISM="Pseudokeronopsis sp., Strain Brazil" /LENGTH=35 /DNA_ID= /DNA_START= /DNA_END= /DNA_ORIENTATION=